MKSSALKFKSKTYTCSSLGPTTNMGHVPWLYGKWNCEQCFPAGNERRKCHTKQRVNIIIYTRGEFWPVFLFGRNFANWLTKNTAQCDLYKVFFLKNDFKKFAIFLRPKKNSPNLDVNSCSSPRFMQGSGQNSNVRLGQSPFNAN